MRRSCRLTSTPRFQAVDLVAERPRIDHHAIADHRELALAHDARGKQRQLVGGAVDHQRMAGIVAALETDDDVRAFGEPIDNLAFALVAPLGADHTTGHAASFRPTPEPIHPRPRGGLSR
jgi:hypothetical protein